MVGVKLDLEAWAEKFKVLASNRTDRDQLGTRRVRPGGWHRETRVEIGQGGSSAYWGCCWDLVLVVAMGLFLRLPVPSLWGHTLHVPFGWEDSSGGMTILLTSPSALLLVDSVIPQAAVRWTVRPTTRWVWKGRGTAVGVYGMAGRGSCPVFTQPVHPPCPLLLPKLSQTNPPHRDEDLGVAPWTGNSLRVKLLGWMVSLAPCTQLGCSWH